MWETVLSWWLSKANTWPAAHCGSAVLALLVAPTEAPETSLAFFTSFLKSYEENDLLMGISESEGS